MQNFVCSGGLASSTVDGGLVFKEVRPVLNHALLSFTTPTSSVPNRVKTGRISAIPEIPGVEIGVP